MAFLAFKFFQLLSQLSTGTKRPDLHQGLTPSGLRGDGSNGMFFQIEQPDDELVFRAESLQQLSHQFAGVRRLSGMGLGFVVQNGIKNFGLSLR